MHIAPLEKLMTASMGFSEEMSYVITKSAGIGEVIFGVLLFIFYRHRALIVMNILGLLGLLLFVALFQPQLLVEAFNPVTTNLTLIGLSFILLQQSKASEHRLDTKN